MNKRLSITILIALFLALATFLAIRFAKGTRFNLKEKKITETGLLVANSYPTGASVLLNNKLTTATNDTLNIPPGDYQVKIVKDGYLPWQKTLKIEKELVTQTNARLFPAVPDLKALTSSGALNIVPSPDGEKIAFVTASASASSKNGLYILDLSKKVFSFSQGTKFIAKNFGRFYFPKVKLVWSPDSKQILAWNKDNAFLLDAEKFNDLASQKDVTVTLSLILNEWEEILSKEKKAKLKKLPLAMEKIATISAKNVYFSPDEEKMLYTATASAQIPEKLIPPLPASNSQKQERNIKKGNIYVYDLKEDKNFYIAKAQEATSDKKENINPIEKRLNSIQNQYSPLYIQAVQWFPTSAHLILIEKDKISILEYDGTNKQTIYSGLFKNSFCYPWPDGSSLVILTTLNPDSSLPANLYAIDLK